MRNRAHLAARPAPEPFSATAPSLEVTATRPVVQVNRDDSWIAEFSAREREAYMRNGQPSVLIVCPAVALQIAAFHEPSSEGQVFGLAVFVDPAMVAGVKVLASFADGLDVAIRRAM